MHQPQTPETGEEGKSAKFVWRKHSKLQTFMEALYEERTGLSATDLNCGELTLEIGDIDTLEQAINGSALPPLRGWLPLRPSVPGRTGQLL